MYLRSTSELFEKKNERRLKRVIEGLEKMKDCFRNKDIQQLQVFHREYVLNRRIHIYESRLFLLEKLFLEKGNHEVELTMDEVELVSDLDYHQAIELMKETYPLSNDKEKRLEELLEKERIENVKKNCRYLEEYLEMFADGFYLGVMKVHFGTIRNLILYGIEDHLIMKLMNISMDQLLDHKEMLELGTNE